MNKFFVFFRENKTFISLLMGCLCLLALFVGVATASGSWPGTDASAQILSALAGAVVAAIITLFLLLGQTSSEEKKERNTKVFEEKLRIYQAFLHCLYEVIKDGEVSEEEAIRLQFQTSFITMHTDSEHIKVIAQQVQSIVSDLKNKEGNPNNTKNDAENNARNNENLMRCLFVIVEEFKKELYHSNLTTQDRDNIAKAVEAFSSIMDAVEVKEEISSTEVMTTEEANKLSQVLKGFVDKLHQRLESKLMNWSFERGELEKGIYINFAYKGLEEAVRVMIGYEESKESNGDHYFQVHLDYDDSHEIYKHMKWRFGGRQNKWSWWKYLDQDFRSLANVDDIQKRDWEKTLTYCEMKLSELLSYVETLVKVRDEIYDKVPKDEANVWLYYETCVAFDYDKSLTDKLFFDVVLKDDSYYIEIGNRDNDDQMLLSRLKQMGFTLEKQDLKEKRYRAYEKLTAEEAVAKVIELNNKL
ncbi:MAG: hypothetical protein IK144_13565 [Bacteroidaceae bacterium]|nr:hypothetical protein [Bacteroidaceae bacterium]